MMLKVAHLAFCSTEMEREIAYFENKGYKLSYLEKKVKNPIIKHTLVKKFTDQHDLSFLQKEGEVGIEVINYNHAVNLENFFDPYFENYNNIVIKTADLKSSVLFWQALGFKMEENKNSDFTDSVSLVFRSPLAKDFIINLKENAGNKSNFLDTKGWCCVALASTNVSVDNKEISNRGFFTTTIKELIVNNKTIRVCFCKGPGGELVELLEVKRR